MQRWWFGTAAHWQKLIHSVVSAGARLISSSALRCRAAVSDPDPTAATPGLKSFLPASRARMMRAGAASWQHSLDVLPSLQRRVQVRTRYLGLPSNQRRHEGNENGHSPWPTRLDRGRYLPVVGGREDTRQYFQLSPPVAGGCNEHWPRASPRVGKARQVR